MRLLRRMLLQQFIPIFVVALLFFVLLLQLIDVFSSIWRYFAHNVPFSEVAQIALLYVPKCVSFALPVSFLFAVAYSLGLLYGNNELVAVFGSGVSLYRLVLPFLVLGVALSVGGFFFEDQVVIPTFHSKNELYDMAVRQVTSLSQSNVAVTSPDQRVVYVADYYNDSLSRLTGVTVIVRDEHLALQTRIDAQMADWKDGRWVLQACRIFTWDAGTRLLSDRTAPTFDSPLLSEPPATFRRLARNIEEMSRTESERYVAMIRRAGLPYREALTDLYRKYSFAFTPLVVAFIASSLG
ncbi:MAG TPA: LptF/LptG family permease, partial [Spirochaetia bacterium]|nr:LptF/LptG family permease [Spirochaetia bacterium]